MSHYLPPDVQKRLEDQEEAASQQTTRQYEQQGILGYGLAIFGVLFVAIAMVIVGGSIPGAIITFVVGIAMLVGGFQILWSRRR